MKDLDHETVEKAEVDEKKFNFIHRWRKLSFYG